MFWYALADFNFLMLFYRLYFLVVSLLTHHLKLLDCDLALRLLLHLYSSFSCYCHFTRPHVIINTSDSHAEISSEYKL